MELKSVNTVLVIVTSDCHTAKGTLWLTNKTGAIRLRRITVSPLANRRQKTYQGIGISTIDPLLRRAIASFARLLESRRTLKATPTHHNGTSRLVEANTDANALKLYREQVFPPTLPFVQEEWQCLLDNLPTEELIILSDRVGTGNDDLLCAQ